MSTKLYNVAMSRMARFVLKKNNDSLFSYVYLKGMICCLYKYEKMKCVRNIIHFYVAILKATFSKRTKWTNNWCQDIVWSGFIFDFVTLTSIENSTFLKTQLYHMYQLTWSQDIILTTNNDHLPYTLVPYWMTVLQRIFEKSEPNRA